MKHENIIIYNPTVDCALATVLLLDALRPSSASIGFAVFRPGELPSFVTKHGSLCREVLGHMGSSEVTIYTVGFEPTKDQVKYLTDKFKKLVSCEEELLESFDPTTENISLAMWKHYHPEGSEEDIPKLVRMVNKVEMDEGDQDGKDLYSHLQDTGAERRVLTGVVRRALEEDSILTHIINKGSMFGI